MCGQRTRRTRSLRGEGELLRFGGSGIVKIVIYVKNYPQKRSFWLADYHPRLLGLGCLPPYRMPERLVRSCVSWWDNNMFNLQ